MPYFLEPADIDWGDDNVPVSSAYGDVYYSRDHGLDETRHVFLANNHLPSRWETLKQPSFTIGETGFGTGLNFLAAWQLWQKSPASSHASLQFVSVEKHPIRRRDLRKALTQWPQLAELSSQLLSQYPALIRGHHRLSFDQGNVVLDLVFDDAEAALSNLLASSHPAFVRHGPAIDAWFLDGFAPGSNPGMWTDALFDHVAALSRKSTTFATFTAAGFVRRALQSRGFAVEKVSGFGRKREMLRGELAEEDIPLTPHKKPENAAWHLAPRQPRPARVAVVGAGLAGAFTAHALARRGIAVDVYEQSNQIANGASGNPQGILYTKLSHQAGQLNRFALASFLHALRFYQQLEKLPGELCGVLQLLPADKWQQLAALFCDQLDWCQFADQQQASELTGLPLGGPGVFYPGAGWLRPAQLCRQLLQHPRIQLHLDTGVRALEERRDGWQLLTRGGETSAEIVVIATANDALNLSQTQHLPLKPVRGQLSYFPANAVQPQPKTVVCHEGYLAPPIDGQMIIGASYNTRSQALSLETHEHASNIEKLNTAIPRIRVTSEPISGRAALRCTSPDYLPVVGPAPVAEQQQEHFAALADNAKRVVSTVGAYYPGLYINLAHGSRGLTSAPVCAELLASQICGEIAPLPRDLIRALSPSRFLIRNLIRGLTKT